MMCAPGHERDLLPVAEPTSRRDPRLAPDPGLDLFVADLFKPACPAGALPPHPGRDLVTCALAPAVTPVGDAYLLPVCVVCVMLGAGFCLVPIAPLPPRQARQDQMCAIAVRSRAQYQLCFGRHWVITNTGQARHSRHFCPDELRAYAANSVVLGHWDTDSRPCWCLRTVVEAGVATALLVAAGAHPRGELTHEDGIIVRTGDPDTSTFADCNSVRMTIGDLGHWLLRLHQDKHRSRALVPSGITRPILELLGYVPANPPWWRSEESRDHHLSWIYCGGERTTARHPAGRMYARGGVLPDVCSAYTTREQLNCLVTQAAV